MKLTRHISCKEFNTSNYSSIETVTIFNIIKACAKKWSRTFVLHMLYTEVRKHFLWKAVFVKKQMKLRVIMLITGNAWRELLAKILHSVVLHCKFCMSRIHEVNSFTNYSTSFVNQVFSIALNLLSLAYLHLHTKPYDICEHEVSFVNNNTYI